MPELVWKGKGRKARRPRPPVAVRTDEVYGAPAAPWHNRLVLGDTLRVLPALLDGGPGRPGLAGQVALVYVDPPFDTGGTFDYRVAIPGAPDGAPRLSAPAYSDARGLDSWLGWFHATVVLLKELLAAGGSLYVHLDAHAAHYAKIVLDEVFGPAAFQREIIWRIGWVSGFKSRARGWIRNHDTLLFYAKGGRPRTFHKQYIPYPPGYVRRDGLPPTAAGYPVDDVWNGSEIDRMDSIQIMSFSGEKNGYPTQKNESLVARIVQASSSPGDLVLDCCAGSGTTAAVAERLSRRWVACDGGALAVHATRKRLLAQGNEAPFVVQSVARTRGDGGARKLTVRAEVAGRRATIDLRAFALPSADVPAEVRAGVGHWSQWVEGWCVDWDHRGGPLHAGARSWRTRPARPLPLEVSHVYPRPGSYVALVKVFDVLGGATTRKVRVQIA